MSLLFLIPLVVSLITAAISQKSTDDLAEILGLSSLVGLFLSLVLAPWQLQVFILVFISIKAFSTI